MVEHICQPNPVECPICHGDGTGTQTATATLMQRFRVWPEPFWRDAVEQGMDGYDRMEPARAHRWRPISGWGSQGWDLGSWPYVVIYWRESGDAFEVLENVEGDAFAASFPTRELREQATDELAFFHWKHRNEEWVEGVESIDQAPHLRGPYRSGR